MQWNFVFFLNSILLGIALAMDAFSVSLANGLNDNKMRALKMNIIAGTFAFFQFAMPMLGWLCVHTFVEKFKVFESFIPWIALILLSFIGIKMLTESTKDKKNNKSVDNLGPLSLATQGIATSIDALSVGFTIEKYKFLMALSSCLIIAVVTYVICIIGLKIGKTFGTKLASKASVIGGLILIVIGIEIFTKGMLC